MSVVELFREDSYLATCEAQVTAIGEKGIEFDRTIFYPTGGGQPGDRGTLTTADGREVAVVDTVKGGAPGLIAHVLAPGAEPLAVGTAVTMKLDWARRHKLMRMHSCLHLLSAVMPFPVTGGQVAEDKGRLDFDIAGEVPDKDTVTARLNELIRGDHAVAHRWVTDDELDTNPELVKTMSVRPPTGQGRLRLIEVGPRGSHLDLQACGGTHVARTGEIGPVVVRKIENKGKQNRRVIVEFDA